MPANDGVNEQLALRLAELDGSSSPPSDPTVASLKNELDTLVGELRRAPTGAEFENEPACGRVTAMVQALGRDPEDVNEKTIGRSGDTNKPSATAETPLGMLGIYELMTKLGEGGMGAVYKARHTKLDKIVAIKVLPADRMKDKSAVARFEREMRAVGKLEHPNIVRAMDAGEAGGMHYLVMEYVQGVDLSQLVKERGPLPIADACELIRQAAVGLDEAHDSHMVHRDIKPSNIMLCVVSKRKPPVVKILDMGLALLSEAHSADVQGLTTTGQMMGTLDYMAPEQGGDSKNVDIRADIYALGASLYKLLCGEVIYHGEKFQTPVQKMMALATQPAPPIQKRRKGVPNELAAVLHRMLEKNPDKRTATPAEVADALAPFCAGANLAALLNSAGFDVAPSIDNSQSKTQPSFSQPDADTGVSIAPKAAPLKVAQSIPPVSLPPKAKPPAAPVDKTNPSLAKAPAQKPTAPASRVDQPAVPRINTSPAPVPPIHTKPTPAKTLAKTSTGRKLPPWLPIAIGGGLLGFGGIVALAAAMVFYFQTPNGTLRVEINDPSIEVTVKGTDIVIKQADKEEITLSPGEHALVVKRGDFTFDTRNFELKKGETTTVKVELLPGKVQVALADGAILGEKATGATVATGPTVATTPPSSDDYALNVLPGGSVRIPSLKVPSKVEPTPLTIEAQVTLSAVPPKGLAQLIGEELTGWLGFNDGQWSGYVHHEVFSEGKPAVANERTYLALVRTPQGSRLYVNGKLVKSTATHGGRSDDHERSVFGIFGGEIDEVRVSSVARYDKDYTPISRFKPDQHTLALYHCDEGQGDVLRDSSGNNHHGKIVKAKWVNSAGSSPHNGVVALNFTGDGGFVEVPSLKLPREGELTIEAYVTARKTRQTGFKDEQILLAGQEGTAKIQIYDGHWQAYVFHYQAKSEKPAPTNERTHLALVRTPSQRRLYVNGRLLDSYDDMTFRLEENQSPFQIGGTNFDGVIDAVRVSTTARYDKDFTPAERYTKDDKTLALYTFDEGEGDVLKDSSGNNHHGKIVGAKWAQVDVEESKQLAAWRPIFNGKSLDGWTLFGGKEGDWKVIDGVLVGTNGSNRLVYMQEKFEDVAVRVECRLSDRGNSGVSVRAPANNVQTEGYEAQLAFPNSPGNGDPPVNIGGIWGLAQNAKPTVSPGEWFTLEIGAIGTRLTVDVNGRRTVDVTHELLKSGHVALAVFDPDTKVEFRKVEVKVKQEASRAPAESDFGAAPENGAREYVLEFDGNSYIDIANFKYDGTHPLTFEATLSDEASQVGTSGCIFQSCQLVDEKPYGVRIALVDSTVDLTRWKNEIHANEYNEAPKSNIFKARSNRPRNGKMIDLAVVFDRASARIYIDGEHVTESSWLYPDSSSTFKKNAARIGTYAHTNGHDYGGLMRQVRISHTARYEKNYVPSARLKNDADTYLLYHMDAGEGDTLRDLSGNNHDGKIFGAKWVVVD